MCVVWCLCCVGVCVCVCVGVCCVGVCVCVESLNRGLFVCFSDSAMLCVCGWVCVCVCVCVCVESLNRGLFFCFLIPPCYIVCDLFEALFVVLLVVLVGCKLKKKIL